MLHFEKMTMYRLTKLAVKKRNRPVNSGPTQRQRLEKHSSVNPYAIGMHFTKSLS